MKKFIIKGNIKKSISSLADISVCRYMIIVVVARLVNYSMTQHIKTKSGWRKASYDIQPKVVTLSKLCLFATRPSLYAVA